MPTIKATDRALLNRLTDGAKRGVTPLQRRQQRLSFVYGNMPKGSDMTKHQVEKALEHLDEMEGRA